MKRQVVVAGATGGVGQAVARLLGDKGFRVVGTCRTDEQARSLVKSGVCHSTLKLSLDHAESIEAAFERLGKDMKLAGLVNCAAVVQPKPLELIPLDELRRTFEINLFGALRMIQVALPRLRETSGRVVLVSSTAGMVVAPMLGAYSASKFALEAMADALRRELSQWKIGISLVIPGGIKTSMIDRQLEEIDAELAHLRPGLESEYGRLYRQHRTVIEMTAKSAVTPERVAQDVLRALTDTRPKARYLCGLPSLATRSMFRFLPDALFDEMLARVPAGRSDQSKA